MKTTSWLSVFAAVVAVGVSATGLGATDESLVTAVFSRVDNGYERKRAPDGSLMRETYAVANRGFDPGYGKDPSIDFVGFAGIVRALAPFLAGQNYYPASDKRAADLMLVLSWGKTKPFNDGTYRMFLDNATGAMRELQSVSGPTGGLPGLGQADPAMEAQTAAVQGAANQDVISSLMMLEMVNKMRDEANTHNANLLGYVDEINWRRDIRRYSAAGTAYNELIEDIEDERYYVVISAYDMQALLKNGQRRHLWSTRVSIRAQGNRFDAFLPTMLARASDYFGERSGGLLKRFQRATRVEMGDLKTLGIVDSAVPEAEE